MFSFIDRFFFCATTAVLLASGCGTAFSERAADVRIATTVETGDSRLIVKGPARLLHVDVHGRQALRLYVVRRAADGSISCDSGGRTLEQGLQHGASNELNLVVAADEGVCLADGAQAASHERVVARADQRCE